MANKTLRQLARGHADGNLDKESYRKSRAELIQGIISGTTPLAEIDYPPLVQPPQPEALDDTQQRKNDAKKAPAQKAQSTAQAAPPPKSDAANSSSDGVAADSGSSNKILFIGLGVTVIAIIIVAMIALRGDSSKQQATTPTTTSADNSANTIALAPTTQAQDLIREFLNKNNWSSSSLDYFRQQWAELPADDMLTSKDSLEMGRITNAIYKQLLEEQALSGLFDDDSSLNKQRQLVQFATELGIDDTRISLPEEAQSMNETMQEMQP